MEAKVDSSEGLSSLGHNQETVATEAPDEEHVSASPRSSLRRGRIQRLEDFINTDDITPNEALTKCQTNAEYGEYCLKNTHPDFRRRVKDGENFVVAGHAFGCGSSREVAVNALQGAGVECIITKSYSFIFGRNAPDLGLLAIVVTDPEFYDTAVDGAAIAVDLENAKIFLKAEAGKKTSFNFELSAIEKQLLECGGISEAWKRWGKRLWEELVKVPVQNKGKAAKDGQLLERNDDDKLQW